MPKRVLVVDDHAAIRSFVRGVLDNEKYDAFEVVEAANGTDCLKKADAAGPFDLILLDINLPDIDGYTVCRALRSVDKKVPIVFITGQNEMKDYAAGREAGGDSYVVKPISRAALRAVVSLFTSIERTGRATGPGAPER